MYVTGSICSKPVTTALRCKLPHHVLWMPGYTADLFNVNATNHFSIQTGINHIMKVFNIISSGTQEGIIKDSLIGPSLAVNQRRADL